MTLRIDARMNHAAALFSPYHTKAMISLQTRDLTRVPASSGGKRARLIEMPPHRKSQLLLRNFDRVGTPLFPEWAAPQVDSSNGREIGSGEPAQQKAHSLRFVMERSTCLFSKRSTFRLMSPPLYPTAEIVQQLHPKLP